MDGDEEPHGGIGMRADLSRGEQGSEGVPEGLSNRQRIEGSAMVSNILDAGGNVAFTGSLGKGLPNEASRKLG